MKNLLLPLSILALAIAVVISSLWLGSVIKEQNRSQEVLTRPFMTMEETAEYLGISTRELNDIILQEARERARLTMNPTARFLTYLKIKNKKYFVREQIDDWVKYNAKVYTKY